MLRKLEPDGLFQHTIKPHSLDKIIRHDFYARVFSTSMKNKWAQRAYIGGSSLIDMGERRSADVSNHEARRAGPTSEDARRRISDLGLAVNCACVARRRGGCALRRV
jgi:hypothetical protein